jgi:DNA-binding beta-propeller fold protein YncE
VADTGHSRLVVLDRAGHLLRTIRSGLTALQQPYAVVAVPGGVDVLDADRGSIDYFDSSGHFVREIAHDPAVHIARGMAVGPDGRLYVANPLTNSIAVLSANGQVIRQIQSALSTKPGQFNQPSAVAVGPTGTIYVLDNQNNRIEALTPSGSFLAQWSAPPSNTMHSVHLLVLPDGRLLATDPSGALLVYHPGGGSPTRMPLLLNGQTLPSVQLVGLSHMTGNKVLLTDSRGGQLFVVSVPR